MNTIHTDYPDLKKIKLLLKKEKSLNNTTGSKQILIKSHGLSLDQARQYQTGDDTRTIDWNTTARTSQLHVRDRLDDQGFNCWIYLDNSLRTDYGSRSITKYELIQQVGYVTAYLAYQSKAQIGIVSNSDSKIRNTTKSISKKDFYMVLKQIRDLPCKSKEKDFSDTLLKLSKYSQQCSVIFLCSDFISNLDWQKTLYRLARNHEVIAIQVHDPSEKELANIGHATFQDPSTGEQRQIATHQKSVRKEYRTIYENHQKNIEKIFLDTKTDHINLSTDSNWQETLLNFLLKRSNRSFFN